MDYYEWDSAQNQGSLLDEISVRFTSGNLGILPTETVYGLMCSLNNTVGKDRIYEIKGRARLKELQILIPSVKKLKQLSIQVTHELDCLANGFWPGPLTIVLRNTLGKEVGVRIPDSKIVLGVLERLDQPLLATSANLSGQSEEWSYFNRFQNLAMGSSDFVVLAGKCTGKPSTVIRLNGRDIELIRPGTISVQKIRKLLHNR